MNNKSFIVVILVVTAIILGFVVTRSDEESIAPDASNQEPPSPAKEGPPETSAPETVTAFPVERTNVPDDLSGLLSDVPDSELNHVALGAFFERAPVAAFRVVNINSDLLRTYIRQPDQYPSLTMHLFNDEPVTFVMEPDRSREHYSGQLSGHAVWTSKIIRTDPTLPNATFFLSPDGTINGHALIRNSDGGINQRIKVQLLEGTDSHILWSYPADYAFKKID